MARRTKGRSRIITTPTTRRLISRESTGSGLVAATGCLVTGQAFLSASPAGGLSFDLGCFGLGCFGLLAAKPTRRTVRF